MLRIAGLYTCFNRKEKTTQAIRHLLKACQYAKQEHKIELDIYLTDDGSTDGTSAAVHKIYPSVHIISGTGSLFWAEGMRWAWQKAQKLDYDVYLLLNDDTLVFEEAITHLLKAHDFSLNKYHRAGIYLGATQNKNGELTYSGSIITNSFLAKQKRVSPNGNFQIVDIGNANIMWIPKEVYKELGILSPGYAHGKADYDYTLRAREKNIPVLVSAEFCGFCENDHRDYYEGFEELSLQERKKLMFKPTGIDFNSQLKFTRRFFPLRYPFVWFFGYFKLRFPKTYLRFLSLRKKR